MSEEVVLRSSQEKEHKEKRRKKGKKKRVRKHSKGKADEIKAKVVVEEEEPAVVEEDVKVIDLDFRADIERRGPQEGEPVDTVRLMNPLYGVVSELLGSTRTEGEVKKRVSPQGGDTLFDKILDGMRNPISGVRVGPHKRLLRTYQNCFSGREAVDWICLKFDMKSGQATQMAIQLFKAGSIVAASKTKSFEVDHLYSFQDAPQFTGMLTCKLKEAAGLIEGKSSADVYAKLEVKYKKSAVSATTKHWKTEMSKRDKLKWNSTFKLMTKVPPENLQLFLVLYSKSRVGSNEFLGQLELPLDPLANNPKMEEWFPLGRRRHDEEVRGEVLLELSFSLLNEKASRESPTADDDDEVDDEEDSASSPADVVEVEDPEDLLAEIPYEYDDPALAKDLIVENLGGGRENIKAATLVRLVEVLTTAERQDMEIIDVLLITYRTFTTSIHLLNLLLKRFAGPPEDATPAQIKAYADDKSGRQNRVGTFMARWLTKTDDFAVDRQLMAYWRKLMAARFFAEAPTLEKYFTKKFSDSQNRGQSTTEQVHQPKKIAQLRHATLRNIGREGSSMAMSMAGGTSQDLLLDLSTDEIAEQLTLMEHQLVRSITPGELLNQNWNKHMELSPNVLEYIAWFNRFCQWAATSIILEDTPEARAVIVSKFIHIGRRLAELRNFNGVMEILASLEGSAIRRLKSTWAQLPPEDLEELKKLGVLMGPTKNFQEYRACIDAGVRPFVPYMGLHLTDLTFVDDGNEDMVKGNLLNLEKAALTAKCITTVMESVQSEYYEIRPMMSLQKLLLAVPSSVFDDNEIYRLSLLREARGAQDTAAGQGNKGRLANIAKSMMKRSNVAPERELTDEDWNVLLDGAQVHTYRADDQIITQGELNRHLYKLKSGKVRVEKCVDSGDTIVLATMDPPRVFGELSMIMSENRPSVSCVADKEGARVYMTDYYSLERAFKLHPDLAKRFYMSQAKRLSAMLLELTSKKKDAPSSSKEDAKEAPAAAAAKSDREQLIADFGLDEDAELLGVYPAKYKNFDGTLVVFDEYACFMWVFMTTQRRLYPLNRIQFLQRRGDSISLQTSSADIVFSFLDEETTQKAFTDLNGAWSEVEQLEDAELGEQGLNIQTGDAAAIDEGDALKKRKEILTDSDWGLILDGAKRITYKDGEYIIKAGESYQRVYHLTKGTCSVYIDRNGEQVNINTMPQGATFGEMSFINQTKDNEYKASASVVAKGEAEVSIIEGYFVNLLFQMEEGLEARFFSFLCDVLGQRIQKQTLRA